MKEKVLMLLACLWLGIVSASLWLKRLKQLQEL